MANCITCNEKISIFSGVVNGECTQCIREKEQQGQRELNKINFQNQESRRKAVVDLESGNTQDALVYSRKTGDFSIFNANQIQSLCSKIPVTTGPSFAAYEVLAEVDVISAEVVLGMNLFKDLFAGIRDVVGGRSKAVQSELRAAKEAAMRELKIEALRISGNGIIGIDLDYHQMSAGTSGGMIMLVASGTAVVVKAKPNH
ncbi:MAG: heavy metal-binding domain-containing protein [Hyphomicrobiales bacterium]